ncbi:FecR family protein [Marinilabiliaceae bacterium JC017]|nr:FecR family protein [Marinilabiliaceae bacterium JC017]
MDKHNHIARKIERFYSNQTLSKKEITELESWLKNFNSDQEVEEWLAQNWNQATNQHQRISAASIWEKIEKRESRYTTKADKQFKTLEIIKVAAVAACAAILLLTGYFLATMPPHSPEESLHIAQTKNPKTETNEVILTTGNQTFALSDSTLEVQSKGITLKGNNQRLVFEKSPENQEIAPDTIINNLWVPQGQNYHLMLADGTEVWLNAGTRLIFPNLFKKGERRVKLMGEAYFKVKSNVENPFYINTPNSVLRVTGTKFNVCNYTDEPENHITLVEGKVAVTIDQKRHMLRPGEQLRYIPSNKNISIKQVDTHLYTSWINGIYEFRNISLEKISYRLSKLYDVEFQFSSEEVSQLRFTGMVKKSYELQYFLDVMAKTTNVRFDISKNKITVSEI